MNIFIKSKFLKISNSEPSTSTDKKSIFLSLNGEFSIILLIV